VLLLFTLADITTMLQQFQNKISSLCYTAHYNTLLLPDVIFLEAKT